MSSGRVLNHALKVSCAREDSFVRSLYLVVSIGIIALGVIHIAATPKFFPHLTGGAVWFASGGVAIMMTEALNQLRCTYGESAFGLRLV